MNEEFFIISLVLLALGLLLALPIISIVVTVARTRRIDQLVQRVQRLETLLGRQPPEALPPAAAEQPPPIPVRPPAPIPPAAEVEVAAEAILVPEAEAQAASLEYLIGRKALGWVAVVVLLFATAFFLRYAFQNQWIGPLGRVALGVIGGVGLVGAGWYYRRHDWWIFSQMLSAAGVVLLYLSTYSSFGFYHLIGQREAGLFLLLIVAESALLARLYESPAIALMAVIGGLLTPLLMVSEHDQYVSLFTYLVVLDLGFLCLLVKRSWPVIATVTLLGTQFLFWVWYGQNFHPEKLNWAIGFQLVVFVLFLGHSLLSQAVGLRRASWEDLFRLLATALFWFSAAYVLLEEDYRPWLGTLAVSMAAVYALVARLLLAWRDEEGRLLLAALAVATGFIALAFPLEAEASWIALGWAAEAAVLWWFGLRVSAVPLRAMAAALAVISVWRIVFVDTPEVAEVVRLPFVPVFNQYALPALAATACLIVALVASRQFLDRLTKLGQAPVALAAVVFVLLVWLIVSVDIYGFFQAWQWKLFVEFDWRRLAQMSLSAWWAAYATGILALGFRYHQSLLRWTALGLYGVTVGKVFFFDMDELDEIYRVVAFFVLAVLLGVAAWAYQRMQPGRPQVDVS